MFQVGNFELSWKRKNCEKGSILTQPLKYSQEKSPSGIQFRVLAISDPIVVEKQFTVTFELFNTTPIDLFVSVSFTKKKKSESELIIHGTSTIVNFCV